MPNPSVGPLSAIYPAGNPKWTVPGIYGESPAIGSDGSLYVVANGLFAFSPEGSNVWTFQTNSFQGIFSPRSSRSLAVAVDGALYAPSFGAGSLYAVNPDGTCKWRVDLAPNNSTNVPIAATPAIDSAGTIYYPTFNTLYAISPTGSVKWTFSPTNGTVCKTSPAIGPDGTIYVTFGGTLYAIYNTNKLADSPWPMFRQNARHTGKVEKPSLQRPKKRADANFQFEIFAQLGSTNTVQGSPDLTNWTALADIVITNVPTDFIDPEASNYPSRFYRALGPPEP
jgi:hypothetical protein